MFFLFQTGGGRFPGIVNSTFRREFLLDSAIPPGPLHAITLKISYFHAEHINLIPPIRPPGTPLLRFLWILLTLHCLRQRDRKHCTEISRTWLQGILVNWSFSLITSVSFPTRFDFQFGHRDSPNHMWCIYDVVFNQAKNWPRFITVESSWPKRPLWGRGVWKLPNLSEITIWRILSVLVEVENRK